MTYDAVRTFWIEPTDEIAWGLRRYTSDSTDYNCPSGYHHAIHYLGRAPASYETAPLEGGIRHLEAHVSGIAHDDPRWPSQCQECEYRFTESDGHFQEWQELIYRRPDTGQEYVLHSQASAEEIGIPSAPPGVMWNAWWMPFDRGPDGICLMVRLPNGHDWAVDSRASNCTRPDAPHQCWIRHGDPRIEPITVDKSGDTCAAGAGSILSGDYHGFLINGILTAG